MILCPPPDTQYSLLGTKISYCTKTAEQSKTKPTLWDSPAVR